MPLQRLAMGSDYSERLIDPLRQKGTRNPPLAILTSSNRKTKTATTFPMFFKSSLRLPARNPNPHGPCALQRGSSQTRLAGYGHFNPGLKCKSKTRKFSEFCAGEEVIMGRGIPTFLASQYPRRHVVLNNIYVNDLNFILPARLISQQAGQPTNKPNPEDANTSSIGNSDPSTSSTSQHSAVLPASTQLLNDSKLNAPPVTNWRQAVVSSCVYGVALVAVATGYACTTVFRGALNVGRFVYANRDNIHQTCTACTQAVQSTYNTAKRRMVSIPVPRLPVGLRRRYAPAPTPQDRRRQRRSFWQSLNTEQPPTRVLQADNPVASILAPDGMPGVEYSGLSNVGGYPDRQDSADPDAFVHSRSSVDVASSGLYMTRALFCEPSPAPPSPRPTQNAAASENCSETATLDGMETAEQPCIFYEESVFSEDIEDEYVMEDGDDTNIPTAELFKDDERHMELEQDFWPLLPGRFEQNGPSQASSSLTNPQVLLTSAYPVFETAALSAEVTAPIPEHASPSPSLVIESEAPVKRLDSPIPSSPGSFAPPPRPRRPTPSPPPPKAVARQELKSRKRKEAPGFKMAKIQGLALPPPPKCEASSPPKHVRRSNRIVESQK